MNRLRLGTRGSLLAKTQSGHVAAAITAATGVPVDLVVIKTTGDRVVDRPLQQVGGKGLFTKEIEQALLDGDVDLAVHSMKDMPTDNPPGLCIACVPERVSPADVLVGGSLDSLRQGAVVGTGSVRRALQLRSLRPDLEVRGIRGNVDTRVQKQQDGQYDAIVLASARLASEQPEALTALAPVLGRIDAVRMREANLAVDRDGRAPSEVAAGLLKQVASLIRERKEQYAELMTREMGKTLAQGRQECDLCAAICDYTAQTGPDALADEQRDLQGGTALVTYQPVGERIRLFSRLSKFKR